MEILKTKPDDDQFHLFENVPMELYPMDISLNQLAKGINQEFLHTCYVLLKEGKAVARAALYNNPFLLYSKKKTACIGNYECINDGDCADVLLQTAANDAKELGAAFLIGPMNGSTWNDYRFSSHRIHPGFLLEPYHHLYYNDQFLQFGYKPVARYVSNIDYDMYHDDANILQTEADLIAKGVNIRSIQTENYEQELKKLYPFICDAFKTNFLYTQVSEKSFISKYLEAAGIIDQDFVLIAEDIDGTIIGFIFCYRDLYSVNEKVLIVKTVARHPSKQWKGLGHVLGNRVIRAAKQRGYHAAIHAFVIERGTSTGLSESFSGSSYKNYILYGSEIQ